MQKLATASNMKAIFPNMLADLNPSTTPMFWLFMYHIFYDIRRYFSTDAWSVSSAEGLVDICARAW